MKDETRDAGVATDSAQSVGLNDELEEAFEIIYRYRTEIPLGNQPHMLAGKAGEWLKRNCGSSRQMWRKEKG